MPKHPCGWQTTAPFTLLELVIVMVVTTVMVAFSVGTFQRLTGGQAVQGAGQQVGGALLYARQLAMTHGRHVAVLFPGGENSGIADAGKRYTRFRTAYVNLAGSSYQFAAWQENSKWESLPGRVSVLEVDGDVGVQGLQGSTPVYQKLPEDNRHTKIHAADLSGLGGGTTVDGVRAILFTPRGRVLGDSLFVTVGEATWTGSTWSMAKVANQARNQSCSDQVTVQANRFTGNLSYLSPDRY